MVQAHLVQVEGQRKSPQAWVLPVLERGRGFERERETAKEGFVSAGSARLHYVSAFRLMRTRTQAAVGVRRSRREACGAQGGRHRQGGPWVVQKLMCMPLLLLLPLQTSARLPLGATEGA